MTTTSRRGLQYESVKTICENLITSVCLPGNISLRDIRAKTARGSLTTIRMHRDRWLDERRGTSLTPVHVDDDASDSVLPKNTDPRVESESSALATRTLIDRLKIDFKQLLDSNDELRKQNHLLLRRTLELEQLLIAAKLRADDMAAAAKTSLLERQSTKVVDLRPLLRIPPEPAVTAHGPPMAAPEMGADQ